MNKIKNLLGPAIGAVSIFVGIQAGLESIAWLVFSSGTGGMPALGRLALIFPTLGVVVGPFVLFKSESFYCKLIAIAFWGGCFLISLLTTILHGPVSNLPEGHELRFQMILVSVAHLTPILLVFLASVFLYKLKKERSSILIKTVKSTRSSRP
jgi:divalent metal cation (Fe/Co/Zn/Cd) transporter